MERRGGGQVQSLSRGLEILDLLLTSPEPLTGSEIARRMGLHESSVSRILATLQQSGHVARTASGNRPGTAMLRFARATASFPIIARVRPVMEAIAAEHPGWSVNLCQYAAGDVAYLVRAEVGRETMTGMAFPLQGSSAALRLLVDLEPDEALAALVASRARYGWRLQPGTPADEAAVLQWARDHVEHDALVLFGWSAPDALTGAVPMRAGDEPHLAVAVSTSQPAERTEILLLLHETRRLVEDALLAKGERSHA